jgi:hypothetical protein
MGIFSTTSMKIASHTEGTKPVYANRRNLNLADPRPATRAVLYTTLIIEPLRCPELSAPSMTDLVSLAIPEGS